MIIRPSPNFDERAATAAIKYVVLHYTGMKTAEAALLRMCDPNAKVSAHYMVDEDGSITQLVEEKGRAWHAGVSFWRGETDINSLSIGIEIVNPGHEFGYRAFPAAQIEAVKGLVKDIMARYQLPPSALLAHSDIAPSRKEDPGELFPWPVFAQEGMGVWPAPNAQDYALPNEEEIVTLLGKIGYSSDDCDKAKQAFVRRYHPERLKAGFNDESCARLRALARFFG